MKKALKPANAKQRALFKKLQALAERGVEGEKIVAQKKLARLKAHLDFTAADPAEGPDLFSGRFTHSATARRIWSFDSSEFDLANSVKWAIESTTRIPCSYRSCELFAEATPATAAKLTGIAQHIAGSFRVLLERFGAIKGVNGNDRRVFVMGLYDGMMNDARNAGERLPSRASTKPRAKGRTKQKPAAPAAPGLNIHPYTIAVGLGKQIRFSAPIEQITGELEAVAQKLLHRES